MTGTPQEQQEIKRLIVVEQFKNLPTPRNIAAMQVWLGAFHPALRPTLDKMIQDATNGSRAGAQLLAFMMMAFEAGRNFQAANPNAAHDNGAYQG